MSVRPALLGLSGAATTLRDSLAAELRGSSAAAGSGLLATSATSLRRLAEAHGDLLDGARRRNHADDLAYDLAYDLADNLADNLAEHRVGLQRAATVAKALTERQKGGWLRGRKG